MKKLLILSVALVVTSACTKPVERWEQSGVSYEQWARDQSVCKRQARRQVEEELANRPLSTSHNETDVGFTQFMSKYDAGRSQQKLYEDCLRRLGYRPATDQPDQ